MILKTIEAHIQIAQKLHLLELSIHEMCSVCLNALHNGNKIIIAGNGGSAADAQHIAAELVGRFTTERRALAAIALTTDTSILTSVSNDYGFNFIFSRQIQGLGKSGDVFIAISTSGNSANIIEAVHEAKIQGIKTIGWLGKSGGALKNLVDLPIVIDSDDTARIQEMHILIGHIFCAFIDENFIQST